MIAMEEAQDQKYNPDEWLNSAQAARVVSENNNRPVSREFLARLAKLRKLTTWRVDGRTVLYNAAQIDALRISSTRGRKALDNPSPNALRQRKHKARRAGRPSDAP